MTTTNHPQQPEGQPHEFRPAFGEQPYCLS